MNELGSFALLHDSLPRWHDGPSPHPWSRGGPGGARRVGLTLGLGWHVLLGVCIKVLHCGRNRVRGSPTITITINIITTIELEDSSGVIRAKHVSVENIPISALLCNAMLYTRHNYSRTLTRQLSAQPPLSR